MRLRPGFLECRVSGRVYLDGDEEGDALADAMFGYSVGSPRVSAAGLVIVCCSCWHGSY